MSEGLPVSHRKRQCPYTQEALQWAQTAKSQYETFNLSSKCRHIYYVYYFNPVVCFTVLIRRINGGLA